MPLSNFERITGGSIVGPQTILTAAHCVYSAVNGTIILGAWNIMDTTEPNRVTFAASSWITHPSFDPTINLSNDIALIFLPTPVTIVAGYVEQIELPNSSDATKTYSNYVGTLSGWGYHIQSPPTLSDELRYVSNSILSNTICRILYYGTLISSQLCLSGSGYKGGCLGTAQISFKKIKFFIKLFLTN